MFIIGLTIFGTAPTVEKTREVTKTREVNKWVEETKKVSGVWSVDSETWVPANKILYDVIYVWASREGYYIRGYIKVLTGKDGISFEILDKENFDLARHGRMYEAEYAKENFRELNFTWTPDSKEDKEYYFCLRHWFPWDVKVYREAWDCWKELKTFEEEYTTTEIYYDKAQPYAGFGALLTLIATIMFFIWIIRVVRRK